ncbi:MAG: putative lipid II flippase FtsW [Candidatus Pacebacteria bacterium]|nr:putative lipid II flippase FtsW [Candidatus Paceibacterota bacterium]
MNLFHVVFRRSDRIIFFLVLLLLICGVLFVFDASVAEAYQQFNDKYYFVRQQIVWACIGLIVMFASSYIPMKVLRSFGILAFYFSFLCLIAVLIPGIGSKVQGARRWIIVGPVRFQPSEVMKMGLVLYFSQWLSRHQRLLPFLFFMGSIFGLVMLQPDLGSALVLGTIGFVLYVVSGGAWKDTVSVVGLGFLGVVLLILISPYRMERLKTFLRSEEDPLGASYHIRQITIALGSGGWFGQGIGQSKQKYQYIPEASTDSIFAIAAEEIGFFGSTVIVFLYMSLCWQGFSIAQKTSDPYTRLLTVGLTTWIGAQSLINLGSIVSLIPLTGVPLPFVSYGGSSLVSVLAASGILMGIGRRAS